LVSFSGTITSSKRDHYSQIQNGPLIFDPMERGQHQKLPPAGTDWSADQRVAWLQLMIMGFQVAYGPKEEITAKKEAAN
jgi:hypothetical protein